MSPKAETQLEDNTGENATQQFHDTRAGPGSHQQDNGLLPPHKCSDPHACTATVHKTAAGGDTEMPWCSKARRVRLTSCVVIQRQANLGWQGSDGKHLTSRIDQCARNRIRTRCDAGTSPGAHGDVDGLNARSQVVAAHGDKNNDNCDETLLRASEATAFRSATMKLATVAATIQTLAFVANGLAGRMEKNPRLTHGTG